MREVEREIDSQIASLLVWKSQREALLLTLINFYKDSMNEVFMRLMHGRLFGNLESTRTAIVREHYLHSGIFQLLKWAVEFGRDQGNPSNLSLSDLETLVELGNYYVMLVDLLKMGKHNKVAIQVDRTEHTVTVFEGGDLTGSDRQLIDHQLDTLPYYSHSSFVNDEDQLTARWTAGEYRTVIDRLGRMASMMETSQGISTFPGLEAAVSLPKIIEIPQLNLEYEQYVLEDLTLTPAKINNHNKWRFTTWLDTPITMVGHSMVAVTNALKAVAGPGKDDHMLRNAARIDPVQYSRVSTLREARMIEHCTRLLEPRGWNVTPHHRLRDPLAELDIYATQGDQGLVLQLKSTLRPETPWEVQKRNEELLAGIDHTAAALARLAGNTIGFVITDGYRGDYVTWAKSMERNIMVGTIRDIEDVANTPHIAQELLRQRAGFNPHEASHRLPDRHFKLFGWSFRLVDEPEPLH